ncbi:hypothetical protein TrRE_jg2966, partial [Triparma retinervis]
LTSSSPSPIFTVTQEAVSRINSVMSTKADRDLHLRSLKYIRGSTVHFETEMIGSRFIIKDNPQSANACGCGSSFALKNFEENKPV